MSDASMPKLTYYDITSNQWPRSWSPFTARTTLCLNYLQLQYSHISISYPDIASKLQSLNVPPPPNTENDTIRWTLPAVTFGNETVMGSTEIAHKLASLSPELDAKLFPDGEKSHEAAKKLGTSMSQDFWKHVVPFVPAILDDRGAEYFYRTREPRLGNLRKWEDTVVDGLEVEKGLKERVQEAVEPMSKIYEEANGEGKGIFLGGREEPSWPDFVMVALVHWWRAARGDKEVMAGLEAAGDGRLAKVYKACEHLLTGKGT